MIDVFDISGFYIILSILFGSLVSYLFYYKENNINNNKLLYFLFTIRSIFFSILFFLLFNPTYRFFHRQIEKPVVIIAQDNSTSITNSTYELLNNIGSNLIDFDVHYLSFSSVVTDGLNLVNGGLKTNYSKFFNEIDSRFKNRNVQACIFASDGLYNAGSNPLYNNNILFPIYPIALGDTIDKKDVGIVKAEHNEVSFLGNMVPINIGISMKNAKGESVTVSILNKGIIIYNKKIDIKSNDEYLSLDILVKLTDLGLQKYNIKISSLDGEQNLINNNYTTFIDVIDSKYKVLALYKNIHPDIAAFNNVLNDYKHFDLKLKHVDEFDENINEYNLLVIFGDIDKENIVSIINDSKVSLMIFDFNKSSFRNKLNNIISFSPKGNNEMIYVTKNSSFSKYTFSEGLLEFIKSSPPLNTSYGDYNLINGVEVVLYQRKLDEDSDKPIVSLFEKDKRKIAFLTAEGFWKWRMFDFLNNNKHDFFNEFFIKLTQYLMTDNNKERFRLNYNNFYTENENIVFNASFFNEIYEKINDPDVRIKIVSENGKEFDFLFLRSTQEYYLDIGKIEPGMYSFIANVHGYEKQKRGFFNVTELKIEQLNTQADHKLLSMLAVNSGGKLFYENETEKLLNLIRSNSNDIIHMKEKFQSLINLPWILVILLFLIFSEWIIRKYNGFL